MDRRTLGFASAGIPAEAKPSVRLSIDPEEFLGVL
jgi:hypothetical protein